MSPRRVLPLIVATLASSSGFGAVAVFADDPKLKAYGAHLARECTACHRIDGVDNGIPSIIGWDASRFADTVRFYQLGQRTNAAMVSVAQSLDEEQLKALAAYFSSLPPPGKTPSVPSGKSR
jgi:cytochrome c553